MRERELAARRATAQLLHRPGGAGVHATVRTLLAVPAQELTSARLALRARIAGMTSTDVDHALNAERSVVGGWLMRGTLHLVTAEDYPWLLSVTAPGRLAGNRRRLRQEGVRPEQAEHAVATIARELSGGPKTREQLAMAMAAEAIPTAGQAVPHLLALAVFRGIAILGPLEGAQQQYVLSRDWLGDRPIPERGQTLAELVRRYLVGYGPARDTDVAHWSGLALRDVRLGLTRIAAQVVELGHGLLEVRGAEPAADVAPRLLPAYDPMLLGWQGRELLVPEEFRHRVHPGGGTLRATALVDGATVGTWSARRSTGRVAVDLVPFRRLPGPVVAALRDEAADIARFEGRELAWSVQPPVR